MHDLDRTLQTLEPEAEYGAGEYELSPEIFGGPGSLYGSRPLSEEAEMELAGELLAVTNEAELEQYMENFFNETSGRYRRPHRHHGRRRLRRHFRRYLRDRDDDAMQPVPIAAAVVPAEPDDGGEQELESARRCVRLAAAVAKKAAENPPATYPAAAAHGQAPGASQAGAGAAHSPAGPLGAPAQPAQPQAGRWVRKGGNLILLGI